MTGSNLFPLQAQNTVKEDAFVAVNLGGQTFVLKMPLSRFVEISQVANERNVGEDLRAQRPLDKKHAAKLATYILKGLVVMARESRKRGNKDTTHYDKIVAALGEQPYQALQPVVANLRDYDLNRFEEASAYQKNIMGDVICVRVIFGVGDVLYIVDGQHRRSAMQMVLDFLRHIKHVGEYPKNSFFPALDKVVSPGELEVWHDCLTVAMSTCSVAVECHINLTADQERQLFHDLNNLGKKVSSSLAFEFDNGNPVNRFIKESLMDDILTDWEIAERDITDWEEHQGEFARKDLIAINAILIRNKTNVNGARPAEVDDMREVAEQFWRAVARIEDLGKPKAKLNTVAAQPVVLKALAKLAYDFAKGKSKSDENLAKLLDAIPHFDFSHENELWSYFQTPEGQRDKKYPGLKDYLPEGAGNRDIGSIDAQGRMRFGAKHNDIYPVLGDMIRWQLKLPSRKSEAAMRMVKDIAAMVDVDLAAIAS